MNYIKFNPPKILIFIKTHTHTHHPIPQLKKRARWQLPPKNAHASGLDRRSARRLSQAGARHLPQHTLPSTAVEETQEPVAQRHARRPAVDDVSFVLCAMPSSFVQQAVAQWFILRSNRPPAPAGRRRRHPLRPPGKPQLNPSKAIFRGPSRTIIFAAESFSSYHRAAEFSNLSGHRANDSTTLYPAARPPPPDLRPRRRRTARSDARHYLVVDDESAMYPGVFASRGTACRRSSVERTRSAGCVASLSSPCLFRPSI
jgi:hypothetical protein